MKNRPLSKKRNFFKQSEFRKRSNLLFFSLFLMSACGPPPAPPPRTITVSTATAVSSVVPLYYDYIGHVIPLNTVNVVPQVQGYLTKIYFKEGQEVKIGDLLATIDDRPYKAALAKAEATLAQTVAALKFSEETVQRYAKLLPEEFVSELNFDSYVTNVLSNEAVVKQNLADIETAKLNLSYSYMTASVSGVVGVRLIDEGNYLPPGTTNPIVILNQLQPITAEFYAPEDDLTEIRKAHCEKPLVTRVFLEGDTTQGHDGILTLINNQVDQPTGSILLRAIFPNEDRALWPGQFVSVRLFLKEIPGAILIPSQAVQMGQNGAYVFVVNQGIADIKLVTKGQSHGDFVVIEKGLAAGERVVVEGQVNLFPGAQVTLSNSTVIPTFNAGLHP